MPIPLPRLLAALPLVAGCGADPGRGPAGGPAPGTQPADLTRLVVVGDSLSAGVQNGVLVASTQRAAYPVLVARQAGVDLPLPLLDPGAGSDGVPFRVDPGVQPQNLAVPGARTRDALTARPSRPVDSLLDLILGFPGLDRGVSRSQVEWAEALGPTTVLLWMGGNDLLSAAAGGEPSRLTPAADFARDFGEVVGRLAATGATIVTANLPDVTAIPLLVPIERVAGDLGLGVAEVTARLGVAPADRLTPEGVARAVRIVAGDGSPPLADGDVLDAAEAAAIRAAGESYNGTIAARAAAVGAALVDVRALFDRAVREGILVGGRRLTVEPGGGLFSLDAVHPTDTAHAILANAFIGAINARFGNRIPEVDAAAVLARDPLAP